MNGFRVECQQLGTARTETVARPGECRRVGHATKLHSLKSHNTHEDPRFGGPIPVTVGTFETKVRPLRGFRALPLGGGGGDTMGGGVGGGYRHATRDHISHPRPHLKADAGPVFELAVCGSLATLQAPGDRTADINNTHKHTCSPTTA